MPGIGDFMRPIVISSNNKSHWSEQERAERMKLEESVRVASDRLTPPPFLNDRARKIYEQLAWEMHWIDNLDHADLTTYAFIWDRLQTLMEKMDGVPDTLAGTGSQGQEILIQNPDRFAVKAYTEELRKISGKLGISHADRLRLLDPKTDDKPENKFAALKRKKA